MRGRDDVFARASDFDPVAEVLPHRVVVRGEAERDAVQAVLVLGERVRPVMDIDDPLAVGSAAQGAVRRHVEGRDGEQRSGVIAARRFVARLE